MGSHGAARGPRQLGTPLRDRITVHVPNFGRYLRTLNPGRCSPALRTPAERSGARRHHVRDQRRQRAERVQQTMRDAGPERPRTIERRAARTPRSRGRQQHHGADARGTGNPPLEQRTNGLVKDAVDGNAAGGLGRTDRNQPAASGRSRSEYTLSVAPTETAAAEASRHDTGRQRRCGEAASARATAPVALTPRRRLPAGSCGRTCVAGAGGPHASGGPPGSALERETPRGADNLVTSCNEA